MKRKFSDPAYEAEQREIQDTKNRLMQEYEEQLKMLWDEEKLGEYHRLVDSVEKLRSEMNDPVIGRENDYIPSSEEEEQAIMNNEPVSKPEPLEIKNVIKFATKGLRNNNVNDAKKFMTQYANIKNKNYSRSECIRLIGWSGHSENTQRDWMDKFDDALRIIGK